MRAFINGKFVSCDQDNSTFEVLVEAKGRIVYTGDQLPAKYGKARKVDLGGRCVLPAFADTHMHFESYALFNSTVDVRDAKDFDAMGKMLRAYQHSHPKANFIAAYGCSAHTVAEKRLPERDDLDKMVDIPMLVVKYDGHAAVANTKLIDTFPATVTQDAGFNKQTGWLYQNAFYEAVNSITARIPVLSLLKGMAACGNLLAKRGLGLIHTVEGVGYANDIDVDTIRAIRYGLPSCYRIFFQTMDVSKVLKRKMKGIGGCFSLALDGCFGSEDAALSAPYTNNANNKGVLFYTQEQVNNFCIEANRANLQITIHAIGDAAVEQAIVAYETALADYPRKDHRHIIIHADLIPIHLQKRAAALGLYIALQPAFLNWRQEPQEYLDSILGARAVNMLPLRDMIDNGLILTAGSDAPCTIPNPIASIHNCVNHPNPSQSVSLQEALKMHTLWAAQSSFDEGQRGSLSVGKIADMVVLDQDITAIAPKDIEKTSIQQVYLAGKQVKDSTDSPLVLVVRALGRYLFRKGFN